MISLKYKSGRSYLFFAKIKLIPAFELVVYLLHLMISHHKEEFNNGDIIYNQNTLSIIKINYRKG